MTAEVVVVEVGADATSMRDDEWSFVVPHGAASVAADLRSDPPRPEELTNAIGAVVDHLEDVVRERPEVVVAELVLSGPEVRAIADIELGHPAPLPFRLGRDALEEVFRTLATESIADRRHNPGLPPALVQTVVGASCIVVAIVRRLQLDAVTIVDAGDDRVLPSAS